VGIDIFIFKYFLLLESMLRGLSRRFMHPNTIWRHFSDAKSKHSCSDSKI